MGPIYILSKGRPYCMTADALRSMSNPADFLIVCGSDDATVPEYVENFGSENVIVFDHDKWWEDSDMMDAYGRSKASGISPVRNFIAWHARSNGLDRCWQLDDDIAEFKFVSPSGVESIHDGNRLVDIASAVEDYARSGNIRTIGFTAWESTPEMCMKVGHEVCTIHNTSTEGKPYRARIFEDAVRMFDSLRVGEIQYQVAFLAGVVGNDWYGRSLSEKSLDGGMKEQYDDIADNNHDNDGLNAVNVRNVGYTTMALPMACILAMEGNAYVKRYRDRRYRPKIIREQYAKGR